MTIPGGYTALDVLTAADMNLLPAGEVGYASVTANQGSITTIADLTSLTATWTAVASRRYQITVFGQAVSSVAGDLAGLYITNGAGTQVQLTTWYLPSAGVSSVAVSAQVLLTGLSGSVTYKARMARVSGTGTIQFSASATAPGQFSVVDLGVA
jgi:hypothetical protein